MCEPATLTLIATGLSTAVGVAGQFMHGQAASQQAKYQAAVANNNQIIAERAAKDAEARGDIAEDRQRRKLALIMGTQRNALAGQGTDLLSGSPLDIIGDTAEVGEMDALTIRNNSAREAYGYRVQGMNYAAEESLARSRSNNGLATALGAGQSLLSGASQFGTQWNQFKKQGLL
jgi:hypothetical protein